MDARLAMASHVLGILLTLAHSKAMDGPIHFGTLHSTTCFWLLLTSLDGNTSLFILSVHAQHLPTTSQRRVTAKL